MLTIIKALLLGSALMLLEGCASYLTSYQTPCVEGHVCECVWYTTVNRSWVDCRSYGRINQRLGAGLDCSAHPARWFAASPTSNSPSSQRTAAAS